MKLTKQQLKQIIKEEALAILSEGEEIAQVAKEFTTGKIGLADAIEWLGHLGKDRDWAKKYLTGLKAMGGF